MKLTVRRAAAADLPTLLQIFDNARAFMRTHGNPHQWPDSYPGAARLAAEIERGVCYVVMGEGGHTGRVLPDPRRRADLSHHRGRCLARRPALRNDPPDGVGRAGARHRAVLY